MSDVALPPELAGLPAPWNVSSSRARQPLLADRAGDVADVRIALSVLDRALAALPRLADPPDEALPADLAEYFDFTAEWLAEAMPTLDDLSYATIAALLRERSGDDADPGEVRALAERWLRYTAVDLVWSALRWLEGELRDLGDMAAVDELVAIVGRRWADQPKGVEPILLTHTTSIARERAKMLLAAVAADHRAGAELREHAHTLRTWLDELPAGPVGPE